MKKNEEMRNIEVSLAQVLNDIQRLENEQIRKQSFINNRPKSTVTLEFLRSMYAQISEKAANITKS